MIKKIFEKNQIFKFLIIAAAIVLISPIISNMLGGVFPFGVTWIQFVSILITLILAEILINKFLKF